MIEQKQLSFYEIVEKHNDISPAMLLHFENGKIYPIREEHFDEYIALINSIYNK